ncbi:unnamed protein product [Microthlaspi erraticum]|nr:unnamed protein product [Microthlaspi erraticum]
MVFLWELISDLVRVEQGWWTKDPTEVWRFFVASDRLSKEMKIKEGETLAATKEKVRNELHIDSESRTSSSRTRCRSGWTSTAVSNQCRFTSAPTTTWTCFWL